MVSTMKIVDTKNSGSKSVVGVRVNCTGRRTYTVDYKLEVVRQCGAPGVSVAGIALAHGINANLVRRWIVRYQRSPAGSIAPQASLLPVTIQAATPALEAAGEDCSGVAARRKHTGTATIELELYGARIHLHGGVDEQALRSVLDVLSKR